MGTAYSTNGIDVEQIKGSGLTSRREEITHLEDVTMDVRIILKYVVKLWTRLI
jgi:hypothetical protein